MWCEAQPCPRPHYGHGLCNMHYQRWLRHGDTAIGPRCGQPLTEIQKLAQRRTITPDGCWIWTGSTNGIGYGTITVRGIRWYVHRLSYTLAAGSIPSGLVLDHLCRVPPCFNPEHLEPVTYTENALRSPLLQRGRRTRKAPQ